MSSNQIPSILEGSSKSQLYSLLMLNLSNNFIDVCIDIYVTMSSDLYGTCRHCLYGTLSSKCGRNCSPFIYGTNFAARQTSFTVSVISFIGYVKDFAFKNFPGVHHLDLSNNRIEIISPKTFQGLNKMKIF